MTDVIRHTLPKKETKELAEDMLNQFPGVDRAELLRDVVATCFMDMRWGNKREEREACNFLNMVSEIAVRNLKEKEVK